MPLSAYIYQTAVMLVESRGREASTGWVSDARVNGLKGKTCDNKAVH